MSAGTAGYTQDISAFEGESHDFVVPSDDGGEAVLRVYTPHGASGDAPGIVHLHGGGMIMGDRVTGLSLVLPFAVEFGAVVATVEYRLAPEHPDPYPVEEGYGALAWMAEHADGLGLDPARILMAGASAGGGLAAGDRLLARDRGGPGY